MADTRINQRNNGKLALDAIDWTILDELQREGRVALAELGRRVGLGASSVGERVRRLEAEGAIRAYRAEVSRERVGYPILAFVRVRSAPSRAAAFAKLLARSPQIVECHHVTGEDCYLVKVVAASIGDLETTTAALGAYGSTVTSLVFSTLAELRPLPRPE